jgi:hypothetical protein
MYVNIYTKKAVQIEELEEKMKNYLDGKEEEVPMAYEDIELLYKALNEYKQNPFNLC